jgi:hypothetical protein
MQTKRESFAQSAGIRQHTSAYVSIINVRQRAEASGGVQSSEHAPSNRERPVHFREIEGLGDSNFEYTFAVRKSVLDAFSRFSLGGRLPKMPLIENGTTHHARRSLVVEGGGGRERALV